jgi:phosphoribosylformylglycinamidine cyclo-ligase
MGKTRSSASSSPTQGWSYAKAGLDVKKMRESQNSMFLLLRETWKNRKGARGRPFGELGHYASTISLGNGKALAVHTDNVGTKVLIAQMLGKYDTIGIDCVAYNVNDVVCLGAEPAAFLDYLVFEKQPSETLLHEIMKGLIQGAEQAQVAIVGGETAVYPGVITGAATGQGFDFSGSCIGLVDTDSVITGSNLRVGDSVIGIESSGIHASGFTLARKVLLGEAKLPLSATLGGLQRSLGEELLTPTKIYVREVLEMVRSLEIHALAHITGGAYGKLSRFFPYFKGGFHLNSLPKPPKIFSLIQETGQISDREMYSTYNMGIGMCAALPKSEADEAISIAKNYGSRALEVGEVTRKREIILDSPNGAKLDLTQ